MKKFGIEGSLKSAIWVFIIVSILAICWQPLMAVINIAGKSIVGGNSVRIGSGPVVDTINVDTSGTDLNAALALRATKVMLTDTAWGLHNLWKADINDSLYTLPALWKADIEDSMATLYSIWEGAIGDTIADHWGNFVSGGGSFYGWSIPGGALTTDSAIYMGGWGTTVCQSDGGAGKPDTFCVTADSATLSNYFPTHYDLEDSLDGYLTGTATRIAISDSAANLVRLAYVQDITGVKHFQDTVQAGMQGTDGIFSIYSDQGATDYKIVFKPHATMTQSTVYLWPANDGDASQFLQSDGAGNLTWATPAGSGNMNTSTYDVAVSGVVDDVDTVGTQINTALAKRATKVMLTDSTWALRAIWRSNIQDSIWVRGGKMITDSIWTREALPLTGKFGFSLGNDDSVIVQWPFSIHDVSGWIVKSSNISAQANQMCTTTYEVPIPPETPDIDSINFNLRTSSADTTVSGFRVRCWKQSADLGAWSALTATLIAYFTATDAWEHKSIAGASIGAIAGGDKLEIEICVQLDASAIIWHTEPEVFCLHHK